MSYIQIKGLHKKFGNHVAVESIDIEILKGEIFGLLGPNGAGKSTTISMITSLLKPDAGQITINRMNIYQHNNEIKKIIGYVPQDIALYPTLSARENLVFWGRLYNIKGKKLQERVDEVLEIVGLSDRENDKVNSFSGGMKRRVNIGAALLHKPSILIMDEPTVGIDPQSRNFILETILKLNKTQGMTVIYTSHYMEEVELLCSRIGIIDHGKVIAVGTKAELKNIIDSKNTITIKLKSKVSEKLTLDIKTLKGIDNYTVLDEEIKIISSDTVSTIGEVMAIFKSHNVEIHELNTQNTNLESVFLYLTGRELRD